MERENLDYFDSSLNLEQRRAVMAYSKQIKSGQTVIVFGPPGTGKTRTVVECILQVSELTYVCISTILSSSATFMHEVTNT